MSCTSDIASAGWAFEFQFPENLTVRWRVHLERDAEVRMTDAGRRDVSHIFFYSSWLTDFAHFLGTKTNQFILVSICIVSWPD